VAKTDNLLPKDRLVAVELATSAVVPEGTRISLEAVERPVGDDAPLLASVCAPVVPTAGGAPVHTDTVWVMFEVGGEPDGVDNACDLADPHATTAMHTAAARATSAFRLVTLVKGTHFRKLNPWANWSR
jgi:hypothetical protein